MDKKKIYLFDINPKMKRKDTRRLQIFRYMITFMEVNEMLISIDFNSDEAIYMQLRNQIIIGIATSEIKEGDNLPSVRDLADTVGINMHTVNKAYSILKQEGYLKLDRRHGAVIAVEVDQDKARQELVEEMKVNIAKAICRDISRDEVHALVNEIYDYYGVK